MSACLTNAWQGLYPGSLVATRTTVPLTLPHLYSCIGAVGTETCCWGWTHLSLTKFAITKRAYASRSVFVASSAGCPGSSSPAWGRYGNGRRRSMCVLAWGCPGSSAWRAVGVRPRLPAEEDLRPCEMGVCTHARVFVCVCMRDQGGGVGHITRASSAGGWGAVQGRRDNALYQYAGV